MSNTNIARAKQLGMPYGTAAHRLRKLLMFKFAQELGYDNCYACGETIETADELSIEHIEPWFDRENGVERFWDLANIAFSHRKCNLPHRRDSNRKVGPEGTAWCGVHQTFEPIENFGTHPKTWDGYYKQCKQGRAATRPSRKKK